MLTCATKVGNEGGQKAKESHVAGSFPHFHLGSAPVAPCLTLRIALKIGRPGPLPFETEVWSRAVGPQPSVAPRATGLGSRGEEASRGGREETRGGSNGQGLRFRCGRF